MLIRSVVLEDVGVYRGRQEFDLVPRVHGGYTRPIILFGGWNGAGKTTLLNSFQLCLYGRAALGERVKESDYKTYLFQKIHRNPESLLTNTEASIQVTFDHAVMGVKESFEVMRRWRTRDGSPVGIEEQIEIRKDGQRLEELDAEHWDDFLRGLLPIGLTELFFFDGEKIERLAEDANNEELAESIRSLLGLDLVDRLQADLNVYLSRQGNGQGSQGVESKFEQVTLEIEKQCEVREALLVKQADLQAHEIDACRGDIETTERRLRNEGAGFAEAKDRLLSERATLLAQIQVDEDRVRELAGGVLPFAICRDLAQNLSATLAAASSETGSEELASELKRVTDLLLNRFASGDLVGADKIPEKLRRSVRTVLRRGLPKLLNDQGRSFNEGRSAILGSLSPSDRQSLLGWLTSALEEIPRDAKTISTRLEKTARRLHKVEMGLKQVPEEEALRPLEARLQKLHERLGGLLQQATVLAEEVARASREVERLERARASVAQALDESGSAIERLKMVRTVQRALHDYQEEGTKVKIQSLEQEVTRCFGQLCHKDNLVDRIEVDGNSYETRLYEKSGNLLLKDDLSAGERQILAIAILWALGRTSGRPLPVMVDTPLARLDGKHRSLLLERYFPHASHQVILFSTDTEVDRKFFETIRKNISHSFHLRYDSTERRTHVDEGYFWKSSKRNTEDPPSALLG